jgi:erythronate-4-phosphate dehydrogenase
VVDEAALKSATASGQVSETILDVYQNEPSVDPEILAMATLATPHIAGYSTDGKANGTMMSVQAVSKYFNLGLDDWHPGVLPHPGNKEIMLDATEGDTLEIVSSALDTTYSIEEDHKRFIYDPSLFERLRGEYPLRREPSAYSLRLFNDEGTYRKLFEGLGFSVLADSCM